MKAKLPPEFTHKTINIYINESSNFIELFKRSDKIRTS